MSAKAMLFDGSLVSAKAITEWACEGWDSDSLPVAYDIDYDRHDAVNVRVYEDANGDWNDLHPGELIVCTPSGDYYVTQMIGAPARPEQPEEEQ